MNLIAVKTFLCRNDVKIIIFCTITGQILQILSKRYIEKHPEIFNDNDLPESKSPESPPRGGSVDKVIVGKVIAKAIAKFLAEHGLTTGFLSGTVGAISRIPITALSTYVKGAMPQNLSHLDKQYSIVVDGQEIFLDQCDQNLKYLFKVLEDDKIPYKEKQKLANLALSKHLNLNTLAGRRNFVICIVCILSLLSVSNVSGFHLMMKNLIKAIRRRKISKAIARLIIRRLRAKGIIIDPGLIEAASE